MSDVDMLAARLRNLASDWQANGNSRELDDPTAETWRKAAQQLLDALAADQRMSEVEAVRKTLPPVPTSWNVTHGGCGVLLHSDSECSRRAGHYPETMHRTYDPSGSGQWIEFDAEGNVAGRSPDA